MRLGTFHHRCERFTSNAENAIMRKRKNSEPKTNIVRKNGRITFRKKSKFLIETKLLSSLVPPSCPTTLVLESLLTFAIIEGT
jgi:hypothetical protein